jgi:hypothetical protein
VLVTTRFERVFGNLGDPRLPKTEARKGFRDGEEPSYKGTKGKEAGRESDEIIVPIEGNAVKHYRREGSLLNEVHPKR